jgi:membrane-bound lytic murein transglycosylase B
VAAQGQRVSSVALRCGGFRRASLPAAGNPNFALETAKASRIAAFAKSLVLAVVASDISGRRAIKERSDSVRHSVIFRCLFTVGAALAISTTAASAASCGSGSFQAWLDDFKAEAAAKGISQAAIASGLNGLTLDQAVLSRDRSQKVFSQSFEEFSGRMVPPRLARGSNMMKQYGSVLSRIEEAYGVPGEILVAIWGLETDFGTNNGKFPTIRSLATLAYDCRRSEMFRNELLDALRIIERGDLTPAEMRGAWAGEIGQTQFMPSSYIKYAVDFDANGRRDLLRSAPDVLASTANFLAGYGWQRGKDWEPGSANYAVLQKWNKSEVYAKTVGYFASQLAHMP